MTTHFQYFGGVAKAFTDTTSFVLTAAALEMRTGITASSKWVLRSPEELAANITG